jgi:ketosteroid isomerase-like protein
VSRPNAATPTTPAVGESVRKAADAFCDAFNRRDIVAVLAMIAPNAVMLPPDRPGISGPVAIRKYLKAMFALGIREEGTRREDFRSLGDIAVETGQYSRIRPALDGAVVRDTGHFSATWRVKDDGELKLTSLVMRHESRETILPVR